MPGVRHLEPTPDLGAVGPGESGEDSDPTDGYRLEKRQDLPPKHRLVRVFNVSRRPVCLFSDTPQGANASAIIYGMIETAKANGLEPYTYLRKVFADLPSAQTLEQIEALLTAHRLVNVASDPLHDLVAAQAQRMVDEGQERRTHRRYLVWGDVPR